MTVPLRVQLLGRDNGAGLSRDMVLLADALRAVGADVHTLPLPHRGRLAAWRTRWQWARRAPAFDLQIMLERVRPEFFPAARCNVLIPNPEYFDDASRMALPGIDEVWCKTQHAERAFAALGARTQYIGFTSPDRLDTSVPRKQAFFHGPGRSGNKGTEALLRLWAAHPSWPPLTVAWRRKRVDIGALPGNVVLLRDHLDDAAYRRLQNEHRFHLCPSQTEGFGHYIVEAMSCAAAVITLDAPPMNELIDAKHGLLVPAHAVGRQDLATTYGFAAADMAAAIERCMGMSAAEADQLSAQARNWFETNRDALPQRLRDRLASLSIA